MAWIYAHRLFPYSEPGTPPLHEYAYFVVLLCAATNLGLRSWTKVRALHGQLPRPIYARFGWLFVTVDLVLIALGLRFTGAAHSPLWIVVFVVIVAETLFASKDETALIRGGAGFALVAGTIPLPLSGVTSGYILDMGTRLAFLIAVSSVTRHLRESAAATDRENAALRAEIALADERAKLSREIHDGVGNSLAAAVLRLEVAARTLEKSQQRKSSDTLSTADSTAPLLREEASALREAMTAVRDWTFFNRPWQAPGLPEGDATAATAQTAPNASVPTSQILAAETDRLSRRTGLPIRLEGADALDTMPAPVRLAVMRIMQEALTNAAKYARDATQAVVHIHPTPTSDAIVLSVSDDGCGFNMLNGGTGIGFTSMRERAEIMGGSLHIESAVGTGTKIQAVIPHR